MGREDIRYISYRRYKTTIADIVALTRVSARRTVIAVPGPPRDIPSRPPRPQGCRPWRFSPAAVPGTQSLCPTVYFEHMDGPGRPFELGDAGGPGRSARLRSIGHPLDRWMHPRQPHGPMDTVLAPLNNLGRRLGTTNDCEVDINYRTRFPGELCMFADVGFQRRWVTGFVILLRGEFHLQGDGFLQLLRRRPTSTDVPSRGIPPSSRTPKL